MSITDELREFANGFNGPWRYNGEMMRTIANRIDETYERKLREQYDRGHNDGFDEGFASADDWDMDHAEELAEHGWVELPKDADGVPIHIGDKLTDGNKTITVKRLEQSKFRWFITDTNEDMWTCPSAFEHSDEPTVESLLRDFYVYAEPGIEHHRTDVNRGVLTEYADLIRKAVEHE